MHMGRFESFSRFFGKIIFQTNFQTNQSLYWKETKNFGDGVSYHVQDSVFLNDPNDGVFGILHSFLPGRQCAFRLSSCILFLAS